MVLFRSRWWKEYDVLKMADKKLFVRVRINIAKGNTSKDNYSPEPLVNEASPSKRITLIYRSLCTLSIKSPGFCQKFQISSVCVYVCVCMCVCVCVCVSLSLSLSLCARVCVRVCGWACAWMSG